MALAIVERRDIREALQCDKAKVPYSELDERFIECTGLGRIPTYEMDMLMLMV